MNLRPTRSTRTDTLCPSTTLFRSTGRGAAEPVEPQHDQLGAGVHKLHDRFQFRAPAPRGPRSGLGTDNFATCILEAANLDIQILVRGADAGISDTSQV